MFGGGFAIMGRRGAFRTFDAAGNLRFVAATLPG